MKICPVCQQGYDDETLLFCLEDGTPLADSAAKQSSVDTIAFSNPMTVENILRTEELNLNPQNDWNKTESLKEIVSNRTAEQSEKRKYGIFHFALPAGIIALFVFVGVGGWFYFQNQNKTTGRGSVVNSTFLENAEKSQLTNQSVSSENTASEGPARKPVENNLEQSKKEITALVEEWGKQAESRNLQVYANNYAETVDYLDKDGAKLAEVRNEIQKIFTAYEQIIITLSNVKVAVSDDGSKATALFDKEWEYVNTVGLSEGKALTRLHFQKNGEKWKIISEKYLKIYDAEK